MSFFLLLSQAIVSSNAFISLIVQSGLVDICNQPCGAAGLMCTPQIITHHPSPNDNQHHHHQSLSRAIQSPVVTMDYQQVYADEARFDYDPVLPRSTPPPRSRDSQPIPQPPPPQPPAPPPVTSRLDPDYHYYVLSGTHQARPAASGSDHRPYPNSTSSQRPPTPPAKDTRYPRQDLSTTPLRHQLESKVPTPYNSHHPWLVPLLPASAARNSDDLPAMTEPSQLLREPLPQDRTTGYIPPLRRGRAPNPVKQDLVKQVMNLSFIVHQRRQIDHEQMVDTEYLILGLGVVHIFEVICCIILTTISAILLDRDDAIAQGYYQYVLADLTITLAISILFLTRAINYESRNGVFYTVAATLLKIALFVVVVAVINPAQECTSNICPMRRALTLFVIICTFLWMINLVMYLTTLYVAKLDLLNPSKAHYQPLNDLPPQPLPSQAVEEGAPQPPSPGYGGLVDTMPAQYPASGGDGGQLPPPLPLSEDLSEKDDEYYRYPDKTPLKEYFLTADNEMYEKSSDVDTRGKQKVILYF